MSSRRRGFIAVIAAALALGTGVFALAADGDRGIVSAEEPSTLYLLQAGAGTLDGKGKGLELELFDPSATVTTFTDRPARIGGSQSLKSVVKNWGRTFGAVPPNAALQIDRAPRSRDIALLELGKPKLGNRGTSLRFPAKRLKGTASVGLRTYADGGDAKAGGEFGRSTLFIDDGAGATFGYPATFYLIGPPVGGNQTFVLTLQNSALMGPNQFEQSFSSGTQTTPAITTDLNSAANALSVQFPGQGEVIMSTNLDIPQNQVVNAEVNLPPDYVLEVETEAGNAQATQSGPLDIPAPAPPE